MQSLLINIESVYDKQLLLSLAKRLGLVAKLLTIEEKEDYAFGKAIEAGRKSGYVSENKVIKNTHK